MTRFNVTAFVPFDGFRDMLKYGSAFLKEMLALAERDDHPQKYTLPAAIRRVEEQELGWMASLLAGRLGKKSQGMCGTNHFNVRWVRSKGGSMVYCFEIQDDADAFAEYVRDWAEIIPIEVELRPRFDKCPHRYVVRMTAEKCKELLRYYKD